MNQTIRHVRNFFVSLQLTVVLLGLGILLIFAATWAQVDLGVWGVQHEFFHSFLAIWHVGPLFVPLPGGYLIGGLLLINLIAAHLYRFHFGWKKAGIQLTHAGLILMLVGELVSGLLQQDFQMRFGEGETRNYAESSRFNELAITEITDPKFDDVVAIPEKFLERGDSIQHPKLPFRVVVKAYFPNSGLRRRTAEDPPNPATHGFGTNFTAELLPLTYREDERNLPAAFIELDGANGPLGTWLVTANPAMAFPQHFDTPDGRSWKIALRFQRDYRPFSLTLLKVQHDVYPGTDLPKNFSSRVHLQTPGGRDDRDVLIYMNNPLRYAGLTFYQQQMDSEGNISTLEVVRNPSWLAPYIACIMITVGLFMQFLIHLVGFLRRRTAATA